MNSKGHICVLIFIFIFIIQSAVGKEKQLDNQPGIKGDSDSLMWYRQREAEELFKEESIKDSIEYFSKFIIHKDEVLALEPALKKWLNYHQIKLSDFRLIDIQSINPQYYLTSEDTLSLYYREYDENFEGIYTPESRDYSPDGKRYLNVLETTMVYKNEDDGKWYYEGSDDCQEIRLIDTERKTDRMFLFTGTSFIDGAFWKNKDCFILVMYRNENYGGGFQIFVYDLQNGRKTNYRLRAPSKNTDYLQYDMKTRGIIVD